MGKTRNGVYHNLSESEYFARVDDITFYFSSKLHLEKFKERYLMNRDIVNYRMKKRYKFEFCFEKLADLELYARIESRGFYIIKNGNVYNSLKQVKLKCE